MFFEAAERRENTDLQAVALIYIYIVKGTNCAKFRIISQVRLYVIDR